MKNLVLKASLVLTFLVMMSFTGIDSIVSEKVFIGTWEYEAPDAPYEYQEGEIVFAKKDGKLVGYVSIDGYKIDLEDVVVKGDKLTCEAYIEGESIVFEMVFKKKTFEGTASYSEGSLPITGKRKATK